MLQSKKIYFCNWPELIQEASENYVSRVLSVTKENISSSRLLLTMKRAKKLNIAQCMKYVFDFRRSNGFHKLYVRRTLFHLCCYLLQILKQFPNRSPYIDEYLLPYYNNELNYSKKYISGGVNLLNTWVKFEICQTMQKGFRSALLHTEVFLLACTVHLWVLKQVLNLMLTLHLKQEAKDFSKCNFENTLRIKLSQFISHISCVT
jgi:hypothetical protein